MPSSFKLMNESFVGPARSDVGAIPNDKRRGHVDAGQRRLLLIPYAKQQMHGQRRHLDNRDTDRGQCGSGPSGDLEIVEPNN